MKELELAREKADGLVFKLFEQTALLRVCEGAANGEGIKREDLPYLFSITGTLQAGLVALATELQGCLFEVKRQMAADESEAAGVGKGIKKR